MTLFVFRINYYTLHFPQDFDTLLNQTWLMLSQLLVNHFKIAKSKGSPTVCWFKFPLEYRLSFKMVKEEV